MSNTEQQPPTITSQPTLKEGMTPNSQPPASSTKPKGEKQWHGPWQLCESTWSMGGFEWQVVWGFCGGHAREGEREYGMVDCRNCCYCGPRRA